MNKKLGFKINDEFAFPEEDKGKNFQKNLEEEGYKTSLHKNIFNSTVITIVGYK